MWSTDDTHVQIAVDAAPAPLKAFLGWANKVLDELEFTELVADGLGRFVDPTPASANPMLHPLLAKALGEPSSSAAVLDQLQTMQADLLVGAMGEPRPCPTSGGDGGVAGERRQEGRTAVVAVDRAAPRSGERLRVSMSRE